MNSHRRKAIFLDIDGTLITRDSGPFKEDKEAMEEAAGKGHFLFLSTGRSFANIPLSLLEFSFFKGIAAGAGAHVLLNEGLHPRYQTIYHQWVTAEMLAKIFEWYGKNSCYCCLEGERDSYIINHSSLIDTAKTAISVNSLEDFKRKSNGDLITKLTLDRYASEEEFLILEPFFKLNCFADYSEGIISGENKGKAMALILNTLGIEREDSIAIGDSTNDLDMIRFAGVGIAVGNASDELKAAAGAITTDCGKGGVAEALGKFVLS